MARKLKLLRGTTAQNNAYTGAAGEVTVDTTKDTLVVHDGATAGGHPLAKFSEIGGGGGSGSLSVAVPASYTTIQDAVDYLATVGFQEGATATITVDGGTYVDDGLPISISGLKIPLTVTTTGTVSIVAPPSPRQLFTVTDCPMVIIRGTWSSASTDNDRFVNATNATVHLGNRIGFTPISLTGFNKNAKFEYCSVDVLYAGSVNNESIRCDYVEGYILHNIVSNTSGTFYVFYNSNIVMTGFGKATVTGNFIDATNCNLRGNPRAQFSSGRYLTCYNCDIQFAIVNDFVINTSVTGYTISCTKSRVSIEGVVVTHLGGSNPEFILADASTVAIGFPTFPASSGSSTGNLGDVANAGIIQYTTPALTGGFAAGFGQAVNTITSSGLIIG